MSPSRWLGKHHRPRYASPRFTTVVSRLRGYRLGAGVIADIAAPAERGSYFGMWNIGPMVGPCLGPVLGGVLADKLGWRAIFWFLVIAAGVCALLMIL